MLCNLYVVRYAGTFGFIKPWTAVRDGETFSQQFLTPSVVEGMRIKLEAGNSIVRHRISYAGYSAQQETTQSRGIKETRTGGKIAYSRPASIIVRHVLLQPELCLAFASEADAAKAATEHLCLCRNEDLVYPVGDPEPVSEADFDNAENRAFNGIELRFTRHGYDEREAGDPGAPDADSFCVGYNRFGAGGAMYGHLHIVGNPVRTMREEI